MCVVFFFCFVLFFVLDFVFFFFKQKTAYEISACLVGSEMCIRDRNAPAYSINMPTDEITPARHITPLRAKTREAFSWNNANRAATSANATVDQAYMENEHDADPVPFAT